MFDGAKCWLNAVTPSEVVAIGERISVDHFLPALEDLINQFPFETLGVLLGQWQRVHQQNGGHAVPEFAEEALVANTSFTSPSLHQRCTALIDDGLHPSRKLW